MSYKQVAAILDQLGGKGGALTPEQQGQALAIAEVLLVDYDNPEDLAERFNFFLALLSFAVK